MSFARRLVEGPPLLLDGGLGSLLIARGLSSGRPPEGWVLERPQELLAAHRAYVEAGSEAIHPCTFGANRVRLAAYGLDGEHDTINRRAVEIAREAGATWVLGDVGPTGEYIAPVGKGDPAEWRAAFVEQGRLLASLGVDAFHVETMTDLREALIALSALREAEPALPVMVSCTYDRKKRGFFTVMGNRLGDSIGALISAGATAVGANCSLTSPDMKDLAAEALAAAGDTPVVLQPNAGQPEVTPVGLHYAQDPAEFARDMADIAGMGVRVVGGCCGSDPGFISLLRAALVGETA